MNPINRYPQNRVQDLHELADLEEIQELNPQPIPFWDVLKLESKEIRELTAEQVQPSIDYLQKYSFELVDLAEKRPHLIKEEWSRRLLSLACNPTVAQDQPLRLKLDWMSQTIKWAYLWEQQRRIGKNLQSCHDTYAEILQIEVENQKAHEQFKKEQEQFKKEQEEDRVKMLASDQKRLESEKRRIDFEKSIEDLINPPQLPPTHNNQSNHRRYWALALVVGAIATAIFWYNRTPAPKVPPPTNPDL